MTKYTFISVKNEPEEESLSWFLECDSGWHKIVEQYFDKIQVLLDSGTDEQSYPFTVTNV